MSELSMSGLDTARTRALEAGEEALSQAPADLPPAEECLRMLRASGTGQVPGYLQGNDDPEFIRARAVLLRGARSALERVDGLQVSASVKELLYSEFERYAQPPARWRPMFDPAKVRFHEMARIVTFDRLPAGQMHWEVSRVPRSYLWKTRWPHSARLLASMVQLRGGAPMWETHVNDRRPNPVVLLEAESKESYLRIADSLQLQPHVRGVLTCSWLYSREIAQVSPRLSWLRREFEENGATIIELGPAPPDSGFMVGSQERRRMYEDGSFRPQMTLVLWPRSVVLRWAASERARS